MIALKKLWSFTKNYWYIPVILVAIVIGFIIFRRVPSSLGAILQNAIESHQEEVHVIEATHTQEIATRERALEVYHATIEQVEEKFKADNLELTSKKKKEIKKIIDSNQDGPEALAKRISEFTGFPVVMPED